MELAGSTPLDEELLEVPNGDPSSYCRLCLSERGEELEELFPDGQGPRLETIDRIAQCTGIQISQDEDYPSAVCWMCSMSLEEFQWFRERCRRHDVLIRRKRKELVEEAGYEVSIMDDPEGKGENGLPMLQIASVQERFDGGRGSSHSLLEPTSYQPPEDEEYEGDDFEGEDDGEEQEDVKPDHEMLDAYAQQFRKTNGESELRSESVMTGTTTAEDANENPYKCADCGKRFAEQAELDQHSKLHPSAGELPFSCKDCGTSFHRSKTLRKHREKYHSKDSVEDPPLRLKCEFCPRVFPRHADRKGHEVRVHRELYRPGKTPPPTKRKSIPAEKPTPVPTPTPTSTGNFSCSLCVTPVNFPNSTDLEEHIEKLHTNSEGVLICLMCPKTFKHRTTLKMHVLNHQGKLPHECKDCGSRFDRMIYLTRHRQRYHNGTNSPAVLPQLRCKFCPRTFLQARDRTTHMRLVHIKHSSHTSSTIKREKLTPDPTKQEATATPPPSNRPELSFGCLQCGKDFPSPAMLREHTEDQHTKKPPSTFYEVKPIIIKTEPGLEPEEQTAPKPQPPAPPKPPAPAKNLPFKCPRCPRRFANAFAAREHTRIHTGKLRFRCEICSAMFHRTNFLRRHMERFHGQNAAQLTVMKCKLCERGFHRKQDIKKHEKIAHGMHGYGGVDEEMDVEDGEENGFEEENGEKVEEVLPEGVEIRDVVVTLERIPDDVLETVDVSYGDDDDDDDDENEEEDTEEVSQKVVPRMNITLHRCPHCLRVFKSRALLAKHMVYHQSVLPFPCDECGVQFARKHLLQAHKERYHSEDAPMIGERFSCNYCSRIFLRDRDRISHVRNVHVMERTYGTREDEGTPELKKSKLKKKRKDYVCLLCNERFEGERSCQRHINQAHPAEAQPPAAKTPSESPAPVEPKVEITESIEPKVELTEPVEPKEEPVVDSAESPSEDVKPSIPSSPVSVAAAPTPQATRIKPYKLCRCAICTAIFKNEDNWKAHVNEHPKHCRPHHCEPCLIKRKAGRSNKKVTTVGFKCQYCAKVFKRKGTLRNHLRLHNSELRFPCDECGMKYDRFRLLQAHKEKYHSEDAAQQPPLETFRCDLCERMFLRLRDLNHHREKVHGIEGC